MCAKISQFSFTIWLSPATTPIIVVIIIIITTNNGTYLRSTSTQQSLIVSIKVQSMFKEETINSN